MTSVTTYKFPETTLTKLLSEVNISKRLESTHFINHRPLMAGRPHCEKIVIPHNKALQPM